MKHARSDYDRIQDPENKIPADEPVFLLRGQDMLAPGIIEIYSNHAQAMGVQPHLVEAVRRLAIKMREWQAKEQTKLPDMPEDAIVKD